MANDSFAITKLPEALSPPDADLRRRLELFVWTTRNLTQSPLIKTPSLSLECIPRGDGTFDVVCVAPVDDFGMRGLLTYFRKLWQSGEPAQFGRLRSDLRRHVERSGLPASAELAGWLDDIGKADKAARRELISEVFKFVEGFYNTARRHSTLGYLSPAQFETMTTIKTNKENG